MLTNLKILLIITGNLRERVSSFLLVEIYCFENMKSVTYLVEELKSENKIRVKKKKDYGWLLSLFYEFKTSMTLTTKKYSCTKTIVQNIGKTYYNI